MQTAIDGAAAIIEDDEDDEIEISLVVDDTNARKSLRDLGKITGGLFDLDTGATNKLAAKIADANGYEDDSASYGDTTITNNNITQNFNYSNNTPLSPVEIYRRTNRAVQTTK